MKRTALIFALLLASMSAKAQFFTGLAFDVKWANDGEVTNGTATRTLNNAYGGTISPQVGYIFNPKFMAGARVNFLFDKVYYTEDSEGKELKSKYVMGSIGWDIAPFCRYRIAEFGKDGWFSIWADVHAYFGRMYPNSVSEEGYVSREFNRKYIYGIQAMPAVDFKINKSTSIFVNVAIVSLAYAGTYTEYDNKSEYTNRLVLFTGKLSGLATTLTSEGMYGIKFGVIRTF